MIQTANVVRKFEHSFRLNNGGSIKINDNVVHEISSYVQSEIKSCEAGGILMGRFIKNSKNIIIDQVTVPMQDDIRTRYTFKRLSKTHQQILDKEWLISNGTCNYLGEWHTHPEEVPTPSEVDKKDWKRKLKNDTFSSRYLYFIIAGTQKLCVWEGDRRTLEIKKLKNN